MPSVKSRQPKGHLYLPQDEGVPEQAAGEGLANAAAVGAAGDTGADADAGGAATALVCVFVC